MDFLIVGAGAVGGYLASALARAGRQVTLLTRPGARDRLQQRGIEIYRADGVTIRTSVEAVTTDMLSHAYDVVLLAVRGDALADAVEDFAPAVGPDSVIIPTVNGVAHLGVLTERFGRNRVYGGTAQLAVSLDAGVIREVKPGATLQIGRQDGTPSDRSSAVAEQLTVEGIETTESVDIVAAMWAKFAFITATATLTCLLREVIGPIVRTPGGLELARAILAEVTSVATAAHHPPGADSERMLATTLTDPQSRFGPSMFRDLTSGRVVESSVLAEFVLLAREFGVPTPLVDAALVAVTLHNGRLAAA